MMNETVIAKKKNEDKITLPMVRVKSNTALCLSTVTSLVFGVDRFTNTVGLGDEKRQPPGCSRVVVTLTITDPLYEDSVILVLSDRTYFYLEKIIRSLISSETKMLL